MGSLTPAPSWATIPLPLQNQWLGRRNPTKNIGAQRQAGAFFVPVMAGRAWDTFGCAGLPVFSGLPTPRTVRHPTVGRLVVNLLIEPGVSS